MGIGDPGAALNTLQNSPFPTEVENGRKPGSLIAKWLYK
jgi:hypothetical protein